MQTHPQVVNSSASWKTRPLVVKSPGKKVVKEKPKKPEKRSRPQIRRTASSLVHRFNLNQDPEGRIDKRVRWVFNLNFMAPFYGLDSTASRLQPLRGGSLLFTIQFPEIPGTHFIILQKILWTANIPITWRTRRWTPKLRHEIGKLWSSWRGDWGEEL